MYAQGHTSRQVPSSPFPAPSILHFSQDSPRLPWPPLLQTSVYPSPTRPHAAARSLLCRTHPRNVPHTSFSPLFINAPKPSSTYSPGFHFGESLPTIIRFRHQAHPCFSRPLHTPRTDFAQIARAHLSRCLPPLGLKACSSAPSPSLTFPSSFCP